MKKISLIVATFNSGHCLQNLFDSLDGGVRKFLQIIIIDGKSTDNTLEVINQNKHSIDYFLSEPDEGIYDAWNKGLNEANSDWVMFVGSDDIFLSGALSKLINLLPSIDNNVNFISAKVQISYNSSLKKVVGRPWNSWRLKFIMPVAHPGSLHHKSLFKENNFDSSFKIAGDYEFLIRRSFEIKPRFLDFILVEMDSGGLSNTNLDVFEEALRAKNKNNILNPLINRLFYLYSVGLFILRKALGE